MCAWYDPVQEGGSAVTGEWTHRIPINIVVTSLAPGGTTDVTIALDENADIFWDNLSDTGGDDVRVTKGDGRVLLAYKVTAISTTTKTATIDIDDFEAAVVGVYPVWIYVGNSDATDQSATFTTTSAIDGYYELGGTVGAPTGAKLVRPAPGTTKASPTLGVGVGETIHAWLGLGALGQRHTPHNDRTSLVGLGFVAFTIEQAGSEVSAMFTTGSTRIVGPTTAGTGDFWVRVKIIAGTSTGDFTGHLTVKTRTPTGDLDTLIHRFLIQVTDPDET